MNWSQFLRFLITGGIAAAINLGSRYLLNSIMSFEAAVGVAYLIGMTTAYVLARLFVFQRSGRSIALEAKRFAFVNLFSLVLVWGISVSLARYVFPAVGFAWHSDDVAHLVGVLAPAATSYFGHRVYTFGPSPA